MNRTMMLIVAAMLAAGSAPAQDWAKARLEKSPRHLEWVKVKHGNREVNWSARAGAPPVELSIADLLWHLLSVCWLAAVAQIFNLLYRRIVFGRASHGPTREYCSRPQSTTPRYSGDTAEGGENATCFGFATTAPRESKASRYACHRTPKNLRGLRRFPEILIEYNPELRRGRLTHT